MRETRPSGSEGGATELNQSFLPLSFDSTPESFKSDAAFATRPHHEQPPPNRETGPV